MNFDDRLRAALAHDAPPAIPPGFVDSIVAALPQARRDRFPLLTLARVAVVAAIVLVIGAFLAGSGWLVSGPPASATPGTSAASTPTSALASPATPGLTTWSHLGWQDASPAFVGASGPIMAGTSWGGGYVLLGRDDATGTNGAIWYSADGRAWERGVDSHGGKFEGMRFVGVAASGGRLVALAQFEGALTPAPEAAVWYSTDGVVWLPSPDNQAVFAGRSITGIAANPDGFVIYGTTQFGQPARPAMLFSADGAAWVEAAVPNTVAGEAITSVVATADGFAAVGGPATGAAGTGVPGAAWWSLDGQTWHPATIDSGEPLYRVVRWADGELRASSSTRSSCSACLSADVTWSSTDGGRSWRPLGDRVATPYGDTTIYDAGRLVRLQTEGTPWATWSLDGLTWTPLRMDGASPSVRSILVVANGKTFIATGTRPDGQGGSQTEVLVGQLDDQPGPVPTPTLVPGSQDTPCQGTNPCGP